MSSNSQVGIAKILVCGCIASGKTSLANRIHDAYPDWDWVSIDEIRNAHSDGSAAGEANAQQRFTDAIASSGNVIAEFTGFGEEGDGAFQALRKSKEPILLLLLRVPIEISLQRLQLRSDHLTFPDYAEKLERMVYSVYFKLVSGALAAKWAEMPNVCILQHNNCDPQDQQFILETAIRFVNASK